MEEEDIYMNNDFVYPERNTTKATPGGGGGCPPQARVEAEGVTSPPRAHILLAALGLILLCALVALAALGVLYINKSSQFDLLEVQYSNISAQLRDDTGCRACAEGWLLNQGRCFYFSTEKMDWNQSRDHCISLGGHLAIITSKDQQTSLYRHIDNEAYWIGLSDLETEGRWLWVDNKPLNQTGVQFWFEREEGKDEPDNWTEQNPSGENCATLGHQHYATAKWFDDSCEKKLNYICQTLCKLG